LQSLFSKPPPNPTKRRLSRTTTVYGTFWMSPPPKRRSPRRGPLTCLHAPRSSHRLQISLFVLRIRFNPAPGRIGHDAVVIAMMQASCRHPVLLSGAQLPLELHRADSSLLLLFGSHPYSRPATAQHLGAATIRMHPEDFDSPGQQADPFA